MVHIGNRQVVIAVLLAATMVLAGCSGGGGPTATEATDGGSTDTTTTGDTGAGGDATAEAEVAVATLDYDWQDGESYTYESEASQGATSQYTWTVTDGSGGEVTAEITSRFGTQSGTTTITGPQGDVFGGDGENPPQTLTFRLLQMPQLLVQDNTLESGNSWTVSSSDLLIGGAESEETQQVDVSVTGTSEVQGEQCYDIEATTQGESVTGCVAEDWPFALSMTVTAEIQGQAQATTYTLVESERP